MAEMTKAEPNIYVNNIFDNGKTDDDELYEKCFETEDQSNYDQLSPVSKESPHKAVFTIANSIPTDQSTHKDDCRSHTIQVPWRLLFFISCFLITIVVSNVITFVTTKKKFSEKKTQHIMCRSSPCLHGGVCVSDDEQYFCSCTLGFSGKICEVTHCTGLNCLNGGSCDVLNGKFHCVCSIGFSGQLCEVTPCTGLNCLNGGSCGVLNGTFHCLCNSGFSGRRCEVTPCTGPNCLNGGLCEVLNGNFYCSCKSGFSGHMCEVTPCTGRNCLNGGSCEVLNGMFQCLCKPGFSGHMCEDVLHQIITSPGYPSNYDDGMRRLWYVDVGLANTIRLTFTHFQLENNYDFLKVYNGQSTTCCSFANYTGTITPSELTSTGRYMTILFTTDFSGTKSGFHAVIYKITNQM